jgi:hypothetical protein
MKEIDWKFKKYIPDAQDIDVAFDTCNNYMSLPDVGQGNVDFFHAGFIRGLAWAKAKYEIKESYES